MTLSQRKPASLKHGQSPYPFHQGRIFLEGLACRYSVTYLRFLLLSIRINTYFLIFPMILSLAGTFYTRQASDHLFRAIPEVHAVHKARHVTDDADDAVMIAVAEGHRIDSTRTVVEVNTVDKGRHVTNNADDPIAVPVVRENGGGTLKLVCPHIDSAAHDPRVPTNIDFVELRNVIRRGCPIGS